VGELILLWENLPKGFLPGKGASLIRPSRFTFLDGMRGLAAYFVLVRHTWLFWGFILYRNYLGADVFFLLSGFVIAYAYGEKLKDGSLSFKDFMLVRVIRLYPVYALSVLVCAGGFLVGILAHGQGSTANVLALLLTTVLTLCFLPSRYTGYAVTPDRGMLFTLNPVYWSLLFELVANAVYGLFRRWLSVRVMCVLAAASGAVFFWIALYMGTFDYGSAWEPRVGILGGCARALFGIFVGILLFETRERFPAFLRRLSPWLAFVALALVLGSPDLGRLNFAADAACILLVFPLLVLIASFGSPSRFDGLLLGLGSASYPVYVFHRPLGGFTLWGPARMAVERWAPLSGIVYVIALYIFSILLERIFDLPVRQWLRKRLLPMA